MSEPRCRWFVPGPVWVRPEILEEMTRPMIGHRSGEFRELFGEILRDLKTLFGTEQHVFVATCSGTGMMEGALLNTVPRSVLVTTQGAFSERWMAIAEHTGVECDHILHEWGEAIDPGRLHNYFSGRRHHYDAVTITHNETSTGVMNDLGTLARVVRDESSDTLILVDAVSSLGCAPIRFDEWGLDVCFASTQKGIGLPPGLTVFAVSERAMERARHQQYRGTYFDFLEYQKHAANGATPFTPSIPHLYALRRQLDQMIREEGLEARYQRHVQMRDRTAEVLDGVAEPAVSGEIRSVSVTALRPRSGSPTEWLAAMRDRGYTLGSGYGLWKESTFRIGHMGDVSLEELDAMLSSLREVADSAR
ncbi:MAG TPA: alanine--glyoxylate aminotransferase family protein [Thermoanaerobaculia bacterium]|nr:alanine--glyoxylate aminotransferase family protein [Thermoanaerobaculia bacterium]